MKRKRSVSFITGSIKSWNPHNVRWKLYFGDLSHLLVFYILSEEQMQPIYALSYCCEAMLNITLSIKLCRLLILGFLFFFLQYVYIKLNLFILLQQKPAIYSTMKRVTEIYWDVVSFLIPPLFLPWFHMPWI